MESTLGRRLGRGNHWQAALAAALLLTGCVTESPKSKTSETAPADLQASEPAAPAENANTRNTQEFDRDFERRVTDLDIKLLRAEGELLECRTELERTRREQEVAVRLVQEMGNTAGATVSELANTQAALAIAEKQARKQRSAAPSVAIGPAQKARVRAYSGPRVQVVGDRIHVTGKLWNAGDLAADVVLRIMLFRDDKEIETATQQIEVAAGTEAPYTQKMRSRATSDRTYFARIDISY